MDDKRKKNDHFQGHDSFSHYGGYFTFVMVFFFSSDPIGVISQNQENNFLNFFVKNSFFFLSIFISEKKKNKTLYL